MQHKVKIQWGMHSSTDPVEYEFATAAELTAFLAGVDEACGWMDYTILEAEYV